ncbi:SNF2 helicase associated domain-containing protein [Petroclostridium sp. X23]|uniref:DEAD/DEAH box helicase n=1 Tax=Petroclostridium sp. X23 TaxID=3045146 RepID=UPI0024AD4BBF|nr:SNF2 helicase associated domain-containing protein [Petroclostridium sp. X23]WHH58205.1 SNF2 helicase associated domain-containing protein [Petroclostridium sp. X23]
MFPFSISDQMLHKLAGNVTTYHRGLMYYMSKRVAHFHFDEQDLTINAAVIGSKEYDISVFFSRGGEIFDVHCTCPAFKENARACKHIIAVLKTAQQNHQRRVLHVVRHQNMSNEIFQFFEEFRGNAVKTQVKLEITYELEREYNGILSSISLRVGIDRLYVVRDIQQFLSSILNNTSLEFGKNFAFDPVIHVFSQQDKKVLELLIDAYKHEKMLNEMSSAPYQWQSSLKGKKACLSSTSLKKFFRIIKDCSFKAIIFGKMKEEIAVCEQDLPLEFELTQQKENLLLDLREKDKLVALTDDAEYFLFKDIIYRVSEHQRMYFQPFLNGFVKNKDRGIVFTGNQKERFVSELLPFIGKIAQVTMDKAIEENIYKEELQIKILFDKYGEGISAKVEFCYGDISINPFMGEHISATRDKILLRDIEKERKVLVFFEQMDFKVEQGRVYLEDESSVFEFIYTILPQLQEYGEIFYSEAFKMMKVKDPRAFSGGIRLNSNTSMLEFSFDYDDITSEELVQIFASVHKKKKYYRLKDGSFIPLDVPELARIAEMAEYLDISEKELSTKTIALPAFRATYVDSYLKDVGLGHVERSLAFKELVRNIAQPQEMECETPTVVKDILRDYQKTGFKWLKTLAAYGMGGILADDMGLGKTLQVIAFVLSEKEKNLGPSLVIAPTSLVYNWQEEIRKFAPEMSIVIISGGQNERYQQLKEIENADFVITSYPLIRRDIDMYGELNFAYCFLDEAQHIKNPNTFNAQCVKQINARGYFALTGTPIENSLTEIWSIFDFIMPGYLFSHGKFSKKYESPIIRNKDKHALKELKRHIAPFVLRRMKKDVLKELPQKIENKMAADMTPEQKKLYLAYLHQAREEAAKEIAVNGFDKSRIKILALLTRLRQLCCHPSLFIDDYNGGSGKMLLLQEIIEDALDGGHRVLLFSQFTSMLEMIRKHLEDEGIDYFYLDGSTKSYIRAQMVREFNEGNGKVFLISLKAGGTGLNLTGADTVIHYDPWWNPAVEEQATDRAYRIGQKNVVQVIKLITQGTIEEKIYALQQKKKDIIDAVIQPGQTMLSKMTQEEIQSLFEI